MQGAGTSHAVGIAMCLQLTIERRMSGTDCTDVGAERYLTFETRGFQFDNKAGMERREVGGEGPLGIRRYYGIDEGRLPESLMYKLSE